VITWVVMRTKEKSGSRVGSGCVVFVVTTKQESRHDKCSRRNEGWEFSGGDSG
jgi:hypothetical protein